MAHLTIESVHATPHHGIPPTDDRRGAATQYSLPTVWVTEDSQFASTQRILETLLATVMDDMAVPLVLAGMLLGLDLLAHCVVLFALRLSNVVTLILRGAQCATAHSTRRVCELLDQFLTHGNAMHVYRKF